MKTVEDPTTLAQEIMDKYTTTTPTRGLHEPFNEYLQRIVAEEVAKHIPAWTEYSDESTDGCSSDVEDYY